MNLRELRVGNAFEYLSSVSSSPEIALKCKGGTQEICPIVPVENYIPLNVEHLAYPISRLEEFDSGSNRRSARVKLKDIPTGMVCHTGHPFGLPQLIIITDCYFVNTRVIGCLKSPTAFSSELTVNDLGYGGVCPVVGKDKSFEVRLRTCPSCNFLSLRQIAVVNNDVVCKCDNCMVLVTLNWKEWKETSNGKESANS